MPELQNSFEGGMRDRDHASLLAKNQFAYGKNIEIREAGLAKTRRGKTQKAVATGSVPQGAVYYEPTPGNGRIIEINTGIPWQWQGSGTAWSRIGTLTFSNTTDPVSFSILDGVLYVFFLTGDVFSWDGLTAEFTDELNTNTNPPIGNLSTVQAGRVCSSGVATTTGSNNTRDYIFFSNIFDGHTWNRATNNVRAPTDGSEPVTAIATYRQEQILAFTRSSAHIFNVTGASVAAFTHETLDPHIGCAASRTLVVFGEDAFFISSDRQLRTIKRTIQDIAYGVSVPVSYLVPNLFLRINRSNVSKCAGVFFDNYYILAAPLDLNTTNSSAIAFDMLHQTQTPSGWVPACVGEWTNIAAAQWVVANFNGKQDLYYIDSNDGSLYLMFDTESDDGTTIPMEIQFRAPDWGDARNDKTIRDGEIQLIDSQGTVTVAYAKDDGTFITLVSFTVGSTSGPYLPIALPFSLAGSGKSLIHKFLTFYQRGRSRNWQLKITHDGGTINLKQVTLSAWIEAQMTR